MRVAEWSIWKCSCTITAIESNLNNVELSEKNEALRGAASLNRKTKPQMKIDFTSKVKSQIFSRLYCMPSKPCKRWNSHTAAWQQREPASLIEDEISFLLLLSVSIRDSRRISYQWQWWAEGKPERCLWQDGWQFDRHAGSANVGGESGCAEQLVWMCVWYDDGWMITHGICCTEEKVYDACNYYRKWSISFEGRTSCRRGAKSRYVFQCKSSWRDGVTFTHHRLSPPKQNEWCAAGSGFLS